METRSSQGIIEDEYIIVIKIASFLSSVISFYQYVALKFK